MNLYYQGKKFGAYNSNIDVSEGGKDSESFHIYASRSGYYLSKFLSTTQKNMLDPIQTLNSRHFNPLLRKTEVWLNYAEAHTRLQYDSNKTALWELNRRIALGMLN